MGILSFFKSSGNYFDKKITPKCDYCQYGKRTNAGNKILCEIKALVDPNFSCNKFVYSPLKRIPVKQLNSVGILDDEQLYTESAGDRAEKEEENKTAKSEQNASEKQQSGQNNRTGESVSASENTEVKESADT